MAYFLATLAAAMLDPIIVGLGIACFFIGRAGGAWLFAALGAFVAGTLLFLAMVAIGARIQSGTMPLYIFGIGAWTLVCYGVAWISSRLRTAAK